MMMQNMIETRLGKIEYGEQDVITLPGGMIGFPQLTQYLIVHHREGSPFRWLLSIQEPALSFLITEPVQFVPEYAPVVSESQVAELGLDESTPHLVYTVVNIPKGRPEEMTLNLAGPLIINAANMLGKQLVLEDAKYGLRHKVIPQSPAPESQAA